MKSSRPQRPACPSSRGTGDRGWGPCTTSPRAPLIWLFTRVLPNVFSSDPANLPEPSLQMVKEGGGRGNLRFVASGAEAQATCWDLQGRLQWGPPCGAALMCGADAPGGWPQNRSDVACHVLRAGVGGVHTPHAVGVRTAFCNESHERRRSLPPTRVAAVTVLGQRVCGGVTRARGRRGRGGDAGVGRRGPGCSSSHGPLSQLWSSPVETEGSGPRPLRPLSV